MYPEESYANAQPKKSRKKLFLIIGAAIVVIIILLLSFAGSQSVDNANIDDPGYKVTSTDLIPAANFSTIQGNDLYSYNGLAFYKVNLDNSNNVTILRSGLKLPTPASITWAGSNGALLTFKQSFSNTIVSNALRASGLSLDKLTQAYVWYLDFGSGKLTLVNKIPVQSGKPYYDEAAKGIYYVSRTERIFKLTLHFFNIQTSKDELAVPDLDSAGIESLSKCSPDFKLCFIARDRSNATESSRQLYAIDSNNRKISVYDPKGGRIFATSKPDLYITTAAEEVRSSTDKPGAPTEDTDFSSAIAQSYDVASKSSSDLGFSIGQGEPLVHFVSNTEFYSFDSEYNLNDSEDRNAVRQPGYRFGVLEPGSETLSKLFPLKYYDNKAFTDNVIGAVHGSSSSLLSTATAKQFVFTKNQTAPNLSARNQATAAKAVKDCINAGAMSYDFSSETKLFKVFFKDDANISKNISTFSDCVAKSGDTTMLGYNYYFGTRDAASGRITSD